MRSLTSTVRFGATVAAVITLLLVSSSLVSASSMAAQEDDIRMVGYSVERRLGAAGEWNPIASFTLYQPSPVLPPRMKSVSTPRRSLTKEERDQYGAADLLYYRVVAKDGAAGVMEEEVYISAVVTPCTVIRGFLALDKQTLLLKEHVSVVADPSSLQVLGLQVRSDTNNFHASMVDGDACDRSVVTSLFPNVEVEAEVGLVAPVPVRQVRYEELKRLTGEGMNDPKGRSANGGKGAAAAKKRLSKYDDDDTEEEESKVPPAEPSFFQKYWYLLAIPFVISFLKSASQQ